MIKQRLETLLRWKETEGATHFLLSRFNFSSLRFNVPMRKRFQMLPTKAPQKVLHFLKKKKKNYQNFSWFFTKTGVKWAEDLFFFFLRTHFFPPFSQKNWMKTFFWDHLFSNSVFKRNWVNRSFCRRVTRKKCTMGKLFRGSEPSEAQGFEAEHPALNHFIILGQK